MGSVWLTVLGGAFEVVGFGLVAWELSRVQRREFGTPKIVQWVQARVRMIFRRRKSHTVSVGDTLEIKFGMRGRGRKRTVPGETIEDRLSALEKNFGELESEFDERTAEFEQDVEKLRERIREVRGELLQHQQESEEQRREFLRTSVTLQWWGTGLFVIGAILSVLGNTI